MSKGITLIAVFYNEEQKLPGYFKNVKGVADRIISVDCSSTDRTAEICKKNGAEVIKSPYRYFEQNVNRALAKVKQGEWVLVLDADERLSGGLKAEMKKAIQGNGTDVYFIKRLHFIYGKLSTKTTINVRLPRLFRKGCVRWGQEMPHEWPVVEGKRGALSFPFYHYAYYSVNYHLNKIVDYLNTMSGEFAKRGKKSVLVGERDKRVRALFGAHGLRRLFLYPPALVLFLLFRHRLALEGVRGFIFAICGGIYVFLEEADYYDCTMKEKDGIVPDWRNEYPIKFKDG